MTSSVATVVPRESADPIDVTTALDARATGADEADVTAATSGPGQTFTRSPTPSRGGKVPAFRGTPITAWPAGGKSAVPTMCVVSKVPVARGIAATWPTTSDSLIEGTRPRSDAAPTFTILTSSSVTT